MNHSIEFNRPPSPPRETMRTRQALSVRVDAGLVRAFFETSKRLGIRHSDMMEIILWNFLGKPPMSFEQGFLLQPKGTKHIRADKE